MSDEQIKIKDVTEHYLHVTGLTLRGFADALSEHITPDGGIALSHPTIMNWRDGKTEPGTDLLTLCLMRYRDWRFDWALGCLAAKRPEIWGPSSALGAVVLALRNGGPDATRVDTIPQDTGVPTIPDEEGQP
jgi:hypothetical protein